VTGVTTQPRIVPATYTAHVSGGTGVYQYWWSCDFNIFNPVFVPNYGSTVTCLFPTARQYVVEAKVYDSGTARGYCGLTVNVTP
jgi:hypothetical protein